MKNSTQVNQLRFLVLGCMANLLCASQVQSQPSGNNNPTPAKTVIPSVTITKQSIIGPELLLRPGNSGAAPLTPLASVLPSVIEITAKQENPPFKKFSCLKVNVVNKSDRPVIFYGDQAIATASGVRQSCLSMSQIEAPGVLPQTTRHQFKTDLKSTVTAALSIGAVQTVQDQIIAGQSPPQRYGQDEERRFAEVGYFGKRVLWPGDSTDGLVYFQTSSPLRQATVEIPVASYYEKNDKAMITVRAQ